MRRFLFVAVASLAVATASAQERKLSFGIKGAVNLTSANVPSSYKNKHTFVGGSLGFFMEITLSEMFSLQPELLLSTRGFRYERDTHGYTEDYHSKIAQFNMCLDIPVLLKIYVLKNLSVDFGPQFGIGLRGYLSSKTKIVKDHGIIELPRDEDYFPRKTINVAGKNMYNPFSFALSFGLTYNLGKVMFNARYNLGLTNDFREEPVIFATPSGFDFKKPKILRGRISGFQLGVGYRF